METDCGGRFPHSRLGSLHSEAAKRRAKTSQHHVDPAIYVGGAWKLHQVSDVTGGELLGESKAKEQLVAGWEALKGRLQESVALETGELRVRPAIYGA